MRSRLILALAAAGMLTSACASSGAAQAPTAQAVPAAAAVTAAPTPAPTPSPAAAPTAPVPPTDGEGDEVVIGELANPSVTKQWTMYHTGDVPHQRDGLVSMTQTMNDPRVTGSVEFTINLDLYSKVASQFGKWTLTNSGGSWTGPCTGGAWAESEALAWGCWLTGSGDYAGYTFYQSVNKEIGENPVVRGVIYEGAPPKA